MTVRRRALVLLAIAGAAAGCGPNLDRAAIAAAKCSLPVDQRLGIPTSETAERSDVRVTDLGSGRYRVTGIVLAGRSGVPSAKRNGAEYGTPFLCEVAPDPSDKLRGLKVTHLEVGRSRP
jgi:hypothetical protein